MVRILERCCCNGVCLFCKIIIGVCRSWCNISAKLKVLGKWCSTSTWLTVRLTAGLANDKTAGRIISKATNETNCGAASRATSGSTSRVADRAIGGTIGRAASGATSRAANRAVNRTINRAISKANCGAAAWATDKTVGKITGEIDCRTAGGAIGRAFSKAINRVWINITIILTNSLVYTPEVEKWNRQPESSSFGSYSTHIIWNATFASCYF